MTVTFVHRTNRLDLISIDRLTVPIRWTTGPYFHRTNRLELISISRLSPRTYTWIDWTLFPSHKPIGPYFHRPSPRTYTWNTMVLTNDNPDSPSKALLTQPQETVPPTKRSTRGLTQISPFLHHVDKIVMEEAAKHTTAETMPWYTIWLSWKSKDLFKKKSMNSITTVICPHLAYNQRTMRAVVQQCLDKITPISDYIDVTHLSD